MSRRITRRGNVATLNVQKSAEIIDDLGEISIDDRDLTAPPSNPTQGDRYIPAATATGTWVGHENDIAIWAGAWVFLTPTENMRAWLEDEEVWIEFDGTSWIYCRPHMLNVITKTANYTVLVNENGSVYTTTGASGTVVFTLPAATVGLSYKFYVNAAFELRIDPDGTETISLPSTGAPGAAGKYLTANAVGESVEIACIVAGTWTVYGFTGTWTAEA